MPSLGKPRRVVEWLLVIGCSLVLAHGPASESVGTAICSRVAVARIESRRSRRAWAPRVRPGTAGAAGTRKCGCCPREVGGLPAGALPPFDVTETASQSTTIMGLAAVTRGERVGGPAEADPEHRRRCRFRGREHGAVEDLVRIGQGGPALPRSWAAARRRQAAGRCRSARSELTGSHDEFGVYVGTNGFTSYAGLAQRVADRQEVVGCGQPEVFVASPAEVGCGQASPRLERCLRQREDHRVSSRHRRESAVPNEPPVTRGIRP